LLVPTPEARSEPGIFVFPWFTKQEYKDNTLRWKMRENESLEQAKSKTSLQIYKF